MMNHRLLLALIVVSAVSLYVAQGQVQVCSLNPGGCGAGNFTVFQLSGVANAHAGLWNSGMAYDVCCPNLDAPVRTGAAVVWLIANSNSHAYQSDPGAGIPVRLNDTNPIYCYVNTTGACASGDWGVASMLALSNSHVARYTEPGYTNKICCLAGGPSCLAVTQVCTPGACCSGLYCAQRNTQGVMQNPADWHCCPPGQWWNPISGCEQAIECGLSSSVPNFCNAWITNATASPTWWQDQPDCIRDISFLPTLTIPHAYGCMEVTWFGLPQYHYAMIGVYNRTSGISFG